MSINDKEVRRSVRAIRSSVRGRVHRSILIRVNNICVMIERVLPRADELGAGSHEAHVLSRTALDYLPAAIDPYLALPRDYAERMPQADGRTAAQILCAQLDTMYGQLWGVYETLLRRDGDRLLAHERFLDEKFGRSPLDLPPDAPSPATGQPETGPSRRRRRRSTQRRDPLAEVPDRTEDESPAQQLARAIVREVMDQVRSRMKRG